MTHNSFCLWSVWRSLTCMSCNYSAADLKNKTEIPRMKTGGFSADEVLSPRCFINIAHHFFWFSVFDSYMDPLNPYMFSFLTDSYSLNPANLNSHHSNDGNPISLHNSTWDWLQRVVAPQESLLCSVFSSSTAAHGPVSLSARRRVR